MKLLDQRSKGQVLVLVALLMAGLLGIAALAIDIGRAYGVKTKLYAAVDAASYEAAKALAEGSGESEMRAKALQVAATYFSANYDRNFMGATASAPTVTASRDGNTGAWTVNVTATAAMPTMFAGVLGLGSLDIAAASETVRRTMDMALVLDCTNSLQGDFAKVKASAQNFIDNFNVSDDRLGLVAFSTGATPVVSICGDYPNETQNPGPSSMNCGRGFDRPEVRQAIGFLNQSGGTDSEEGLKKALDQLNAVKTTARSGKRVIVFFSDGSPNTFNGIFPITTGGTQEGNLYSGPLEGERAEQLYDHKYYSNTGLPLATVTMAPLPSTDAKGIFPTRNRDNNNKRAFSYNTTDPELYKCDANKAARNMAENVAFEIRRQGITVFTIGFGAQLETSEVADVNCSTHDEKGSTILKRFANTTDSDTYNSNQPSGVFCYAPTIDQLEGCFDQIVYGILRISR